jgi:murein L,D-transpeptidase YafK
LISNNQIIKSYKISLGLVPKGHKEYEGDKKTPEGLYFINDKNPNSGYHKNLGISYPNEQDIKHAESIGKSPGGLIKIHGIKNGFAWIGRFHLLFDWTLGCIAVTNREIDELYENVEIGTPIEIRP